MAFHRPTKEGTRSTWKLARRASVSLRRFSGAGLPAGKACPRNAVQGAGDAPYPPDYGRPGRLPHYVNQMVTDEKPPSTTMFCPVTNPLARCDASHTTAPASSCASPNRLIGVWPTMACPRSV